MSANETAEPVVDAATNTKLYKLEMNIPIPSYLLAMAVGNLAYKKIGPTTGVITEPEMLDECYNELSGL